MDITIAKKIEYAEISANAHGWSHEDLHAFRKVHLKGSDQSSQKTYLTRLLAAIDAHRNGTPIRDILDSPDSVGIGN